jgi:hypothetical protein
VILFILSGITQGLATDRVGPVFPLACFFFFFFFFFFFLLLGGVGVVSGVDWRKLVLSDSGWLSSVFLFLAAIY